MIHILLKINPKGTIDVKFALDQVPKGQIDYNSWVDQIPDGPIRSGDNA